jgi:hypothetical protein
MTGPSGGGNLFKVNTDGTGFAVLRAFNREDGNYPYGGLVLSGATLYGTTEMGGGSGNVFRINMDGSGFAVLKDFGASAEGIYPVGDLVLSGATLYGTTSGGGLLPGGGVSPNGTLFKIGVDGTGFAVLKNFTGADGSSPGGGLAVAGGRLFGVTREGGAYGNGVLFALSIPQPVTLMASVASAGHFAMTFNGESGKTYTVLAAPDPAGPWMAITNIIGATNGLAGFEDLDSASQPQRFYRVAY